MTPKEANKILEMFLHKQCDLKRTEFAYDQSEVWLAVKTVKDALEKQIPKKPVNYSIDNRGYMIYECECPNCQHSRREAYLFACCEKCGQALDWSDTEC